MAFPDPCVGICRAERGGKRRSKYIVGVQGGGGGRREMGGGGREGEAG